MQTIFEHECVHACRFEWTCNMSIQVNVAIPYSSITAGGHSPDSNDVAAKLKNQCCIAMDFGRLAFEAYAFGRRTLG